jgi:alkaline phosphatase
LYPIVSLSICFISHSFRIRFISKQLITKSIDVILGGGGDGFTADTLSDAQTKYGYNLISSKQAFANVSLPVLGISLLVLYFTGLFWVMFSVFSSFLFSCLCFSGLFLLLLLLLLLQFNSDFLLFESEIVGLFSDTRIPFLIDRTPTEQATLPTVDEMVQFALAVLDKKASAENKGMMLK